MKVLNLNEVSNVAANLSDGLRKIKVESEIWMPDQLSGWSGKVFGLSKKLADCQKMKRHFKKNNFDLLHIHYATYGFYGLFSKLPYFLHYHGTDATILSKSLFWRNLFKLFASQGQGVLYSTPDLKDHLKYLPKANYLPNPTKTDFFLPQKKKGSKITILIVSKVEKIKGIESSYQAAELLNSKYPNKFRFLGFNFGLDEDTIKPPSFIKCSDRIPYQKIPDFINQGDIVWGQMYLKAMGMSELEAMSCQKPVIMDLRYTHSGFSLPPVLRARTPQEIVEETESLLLDQSLARIGAESREWVIKYHDYRQVAKRLARYYRQATGITE